MPLATINDYIDSIIAEADKILSIKGGKERLIPQHIFKENDKNIFCVFEEVFSSLSHSIESLEADTKDIMRQMEAMCLSRYSSLSKEVQKEHEQSDALFNSIKECKTMVRNECDQARQEVKNLKSERMNLETACEELKAEIDAWTEKIVLEEGVLDEIESEIDNKHEELSEIQFTHDYLEDQLRSLKEGVDNERSKMVQLEMTEKQLLQKLQREASAAKAKGVYYANETASKVHEEQRLQQRLALLLSRLTNQVKTVEETKEGVHALHIELRNLKMDTKHLLNIIHSLKVQLDPEKRAHLDQEVFVALAKVRTLEQDLETENETFENLKKRLRNAIQLHSKSLEKEKKDAQLLSDLQKVKKAAKKDLKKAKVNFTKAKDLATETFKNLESSQSQMEKQKEILVAELSEIKRKLDYETRLFGDATAKRAKQNEEFKIYRVKKEKQLRILQTEMRSIQTEANAENDSLHRQQLKVDLLEKQIATLEMRFKELDKNWNEEENILLGRANRLDSEVDATRQNAFNLVSSLKELQSDKSTLVERNQKLANDTRLTLFAQKNMNSKNEELRQNGIKLYLDITRIENIANSRQHQIEARRNYIFDTRMAFDKLFGHRESVLQLAKNSKAKLLEENRKLAELYTEEEEEMLSLQAKCCQIMESHSENKRALNLRQHLLRLVETFTYQHRLNGNQCKKAIGSELSWYQSILTYVCKWMYDVYLHFKRPTGRFSITSTADVANL